MIKKYSEVMAGNQNANLDTTPYFLNYFKFAPITIVDV